MTIHHATIARAEKDGIVLTETGKGDEIQAHWSLRNRRAWAPNTSYAPGLVNDFKTVRMIVLEYPQLTVKQDRKDYVWTISMRRDVLATASVGKLDEAWDEAFDILSGDDGEPDEGAEAEAWEKEQRNERRKNAMADTQEEEDSDEDDDSGKSIIKRRYKTLYRPHHMTNGDEIAEQLSKVLKVKGDDGRMRIDPDKLETFARNNGLWDERYAMLNMGQRRMDVGNKLRAKLRKNPEFVVDWKV